MRLGKELHKAGEARARNLLRGFLYGWRNMEGTMPVVPLYLESQKGDSQEERASLQHGDKVCLISLTQHREFLFAGI